MFCTVPPGARRRGPPASSLSRLSLQTAGPPWLHEAQWAQPGPGYSRAWRCNPWRGRVSVATFRWQLPGHGRCLQCLVSSSSFRSFVASSRRWICRTCRSLAADSCRCIRCI